MLAKNTLLTPHLSASIEKVNIGGEFILDKKYDVSIKKKAIFLKSRENVQLKIDRVTITVGILCQYKRPLLASLFGNQYRFR